MPNRAVMAARAAINNPTMLRDSRYPVSGNTVATNPALRPATVVAHCEGPVRRTTCQPMTAAMRDSDGRRSRWADSQNYANGVTVDKRWSNTMRDGNQ